MIAKIMENHGRSWRIMERNGLNCGTTNNVIKKDIIEDHGGSWNGKWKVMEDHVTTCGSWSIMRHRGNSWSIVEHLAKRHRKSWKIMEARAAVRETSGEIPLKIGKTH